MIENVVARDGVERFRGSCFQQLADSMMDTKDRKDRKDIFCVRFVCGHWCSGGGADVDLWPSASCSPLRFARG